MLAESIRPSDLPTTAEVEAIVQREIQREILRLEAKIAGFKTDIKNWLLVFFVSLWLTMLALVLKT
jgi:hypothetical protein